jgi:hypothetical protein
MIKPTSVRLEIDKNKYPPFGVSTAEVIELYMTP